MDEEVAKQPETCVETPTSAPESNKHFLAAFFLSFMWGMFGVDRFYLGKVGTGILKLITFGGFGFWILIDLALIMSGAMRDKHGLLLKDHARYKKFAARTVIWFSVIVGFFVLTTGLSLIAAVWYIANTFINNGGIQSIPGLDTLNPTQLVPGLNSLPSDGQTVPGQSLNQDQINSILNSIQ